MGHLGDFKPSFSLNKKMPTVKQVTEMKGNFVFLNLITLDESMYKGIQYLKIKAAIEENEARKYLLKLSIKN